MTKQTTEQAQYKRIISSTIELPICFIWVVAALIYYPIISIEFPIAALVGAAFFIGGFCASVFIYLFTREESYVRAAS